MAYNYFSCNIPCAESCPPCNRKCTYTCKHSRCSRKCGQPCIQCKVSVSICLICTSCNLLVSHIKGRTQAEGVREWDAKEDIWVSQGGGNRRLEEIAWWEASCLYFLDAFRCIIYWYKWLTFCKPLYKAVILTCSISGYFHYWYIPDYMFQLVNSHV